MYVSMNEYQSIVVLPGYTRARSIDAGIEFEIGLPGYLGFNRYMNVEIISTRKQHQKTLPGYVNTGYLPATLGEYTRKF